MKTAFKDLVAIIEKDQALASTVLRVANSAFYGFLSKVTSLGHALVILGVDEVRSIALGFSVHNFFSGNDNDAFDRTQFSDPWCHMQSGGQTARQATPYSKRWILLSYWPYPRYRENCLGSVFP